MTINLKIIKYVLILLASIATIYVWIWVYYIIWFNSYKNHMKPFVHIDISQTGSNIEFWWAWPSYWKLIIKKDVFLKKVYFEYQNNSQRLDNTISFNWIDYIWYEMCYLNSYWEYCFGKIK